MCIIWSNFIMEWSMLLVDFQYLVGCLTRYWDCTRYFNKLHIINTIMSSLLLTCMRVVCFNIEIGDWLSEYETIWLLAHVAMVANILLIPPLPCSPMYWKCELKMTFPLPRKLPPIHLDFFFSMNPPISFGPRPRIRMGSSHKCCLLLHNLFSWVFSSCFTSSFRHMCGQCANFWWKGIVLIYRTFYT